MMPAAEPLPVRGEERAALERIAKSTSRSHRAVLQAKGLLLASEGVANYEIARRVAVCSNTVRKWRRSFPVRGVVGVGVIGPGRVREPWLPEGTVAEAVRITQHELPADGSTHWTTRTLGRRLGIGKDSVARIWRDHDLKPWKVETFKISNDPAFEDKLVDVVAL